MGRHRGKRGREGRESARRAVPMLSPTQPEDNNVEGQEHAITAAGCTNTYLGSAATPSTMVGTVSGAGGRRVGRVASGFGASVLPFLAALARLAAALSSAPASAAASSSSAALAFLWRALWVRAARMSTAAVLSG